MNLLCRTLLLTLAAAAGAAEVSSPTLKINISDGFEGGQSFLDAVRSLENNQDTHLLLSAGGTVNLSQAIAGPLKSIFVDTGDTLVKGVIGKLLKSIRAWACTYLHEGRMQQGVLYRVPMSLHVLQSANAALFLHGAGGLSVVGDREAYGTGRPSILDLGFLHQVAGQRFHAAGHKWDFMVPFMSSTG